MENGIKIMNLEGSDILKNNLEGLKIKRAYNGVFTNSLLSDKLKTIGLEVSKSVTTRDIITVQFTYGYTPQDAKDMSEINKLNNEIINIRDEIEQLNIKKKSISKRVEKQPYMKSIEQLKQNIRDNKATIKELKQKAKDMCINNEKIRDKLYKDGFKLEFYKKNKATKEIEIDETIAYVFWFRTPSKSRVGDAMFLNKKLIDIKIWQRMGLELPEGKKGKLVEMEAYAPLTSSNIVDKITIDPSSILVVNDINSFFATNCAIVRTDNDGECYVTNELAKVKNVLFDGQALLDDSLFRGKSDNNSFMLLRHHFFKACGFRTYIKTFMKNWCKENGKDYNTYTVKDRYNHDIRVCDILMIATENVMKWEKFADIGASFDYWKQKVNEDDNIFGICKVDHSSKYGEYQRMSYQMVNTLDTDQSSINRLAQYTIDLVHDIKNDINKYINFLEMNSSEMNANNMVIALYKHNNKFAKSQFYREYKNKGICDYVKTLRNGKILAYGDNLTIVGNPHVMLLHAVGEVPVDDKNILDENYIDPTLPIANEGDDQYISVYTTRFNNGEYLGAFRNPHNSPNNTGYHKNFQHELMNKYFNFNGNIMAINMIQTEEQDLKNSEDQDSDFNYVTNDISVVSAAKKVFRKFPCIVNDIKPKPRTYINNMENLSKIDNELAQAKYDIGLSSNLAQLAMSWYWKDKTDELANIVCIMSVLAQCAIDGCKRQYSVNVGEEIARIRDEKCMEHNTINSKGSTIKAKPYFWKYVGTNINKESLINCECPMNYLQNSLNKIKTGSKHKDTLRNMHFIHHVDGKANSRQMHKIEEIVKKYDDMVKEFHDLVKKKIVREESKKWKIKLELMENETVANIAKYKINRKTMQILIINAIKEKGKNKKYKRKLLNALYKAHTELFLSIFIKSE